MKKALKYIAIAFGVFFLFLFIAILTISILIQKPKYQTWAVKQATKMISEKLGTEVSIKKVSISFIKNVNLDTVYIQDKNKDTLLYANTISIEFLLGKTLKEQISSLKDGHLYFGDVAMDGVKLFAYRKVDDSLYNFSHILDALKSDTPKEKKNNKKSIDIQVDKVNLTNIHLLYDDQYKDNGFELYAKQIAIDMEQLDLKKKIIYADNINLVAPQFTLTLYNQKPDKDDKKIKKPFAPEDLGLFIKAKNIKLINGKYAMNFLNKKDIHVGNLQISKMRVNDINLGIDNYYWDTTGMHASINYLNTHLDNNMNIKNISGNVLLDNGQISLQQANIYYNASSIAGNFALRFPNNWKDLSNFVNAVYLVADIKNANVNKKDITNLVPSIANYLPQKVQLVADIRGPVANLKANTIALQTGNYTKINIEGTIKGLPKIKQTIFDLKVNRLATNSKELTTLLPFLKLPKQVADAGAVNFTGTYKGKINDFYAKGLLTTENLGKLDADIHLQLPKGKQPIYAGNLVAKEINLAQLTGNSKLLGTVDIDVNAAGNGFDLNNINTKLVGAVRNFYFNGFEFDEIKLNGWLDKKKFTGRAFYDDGCFLIDFNGLVDFNDKIPNYNFYTQIKNANLKTLGLSKDSISISLDGKINGSGIKIDNINGIANLDNIIIQNQKNILMLSNVVADIKSETHFKHYVVKSNEVDIDIKGDFNPVTIVPSGKIYLKNYSKLIVPTEKDYKNNEAQQLQAKVKLYSDFGTLFKVFIPKLNYISDLNLSATFNNTKDDLNLILYADSINYDNKSLQTIRLESYNRGAELLNELLVKQIDLGKIKFDDIYLDVNSSLEQLLASLSVEPPTSKNGIQMVSTLDFFGDTITAKILDSELKLNNKKWNIEKGNSITIYDSIFETQNFKLIQNQQEITLQNGKNTLADITLRLKNLELPDFAQVVLDSNNIVKTGTLSGNVNLKNVLKQPLANTDLTINNLKVLDYQIDYIGLDAVYGRNGKKIAELGGTIEDDDYQLSFNGSYDMQQKGKEILDVDAIIDRLNLSFLQTILKNEISVNNAFVSGQVKASGNLKNIKLNGQANFLDTANVKLKILGTTFNIPTNEEVILNNVGFDFKEMTVFDDKGNAALLKGRLLHNSFKDFVVDKVIFNAPTGYHFLNTTFAENQDFYGEVFANGVATINGPFEDLLIDVTAKTLPNTVFNLPVSEESGQKTYPYIIFFDPNDTTKVLKEKVKLSGLTIDMKIEATPDAEVNIILDQSTNDKISGRGSGNLTMNLDKKGRIDLNGKYVINKGNYNFRFQNVITKNFIVREGSSVTFAGDPMDAILDINAMYNVNASLRNITDSSSSYANRTIPIDLNLLLTNTLDKPDINFLISPSNTSIESQNDEIKQLLDKINNNKTEVYNQAFGLLLFNSFIPSQAYSSSNQQFSGASNSFTQFFTQQLSNFLTQGLSQVIKGASLNVLLNDIEVKESRQFGFSYKQELLNSRLIFTLGGNVNFGTGTTTTNSTISNRNNSTFTSDFVLEYLITPDGRIRLKTFAKTGDFDLINQDRVRTGGAIAFQKDFDNFKEFFRTTSKETKIRQER